MDKVLITGGSGVLGKKLIEVFEKSHYVLFPDSSQLNIEDDLQCKNYIQSYSPQIIIHAAAYVDTFGCELNPKKAIDTNVIGTCNITKASIDLQKTKLVYISSEYVFSGNKGNYKIEDRLDPINCYGKTKAAGEYIVSLFPNHQIIRCPFIKKIHSSVFTDQYCSRYFLDDVINKLKHNILNNDKKLIHISSDRKSLYETYIEKGYEVSPMTMDEKTLQVIPKDTSLINNCI